MHAKEGIAQQWYKWYRHTQFRAAHKHSKLNRLVTGRTYNVQCSMFKAEDISHYCTTDNTPWRYSEHTHARTHAHNHAGIHIHARTHTCPLRWQAPTQPQEEGPHWLGCAASSVVAARGAPQSLGGGGAWMGGGREREGGNGCKS